MGKETIKQIIEIILECTCCIDKPRGFARSEWSCTNCKKKREINQVLDDSVFNQKLNQESE